MALKIRMARGGYKKRPVYRVVVTDSRNPRDGRFIEKLGTHNPLLESSNTNRFVVNEERVKYWLSVGAVASDRVNKYLAGMGIQDLYTRTERPNKSKPKKKAQERLEAQLEKKKAAEEAEAQAKIDAEAQEKVAEEATQQEDAPVSEAPAAEQSTDAPAEAQSEDAQETAESGDDAAPAAESENTDAAAEEENSSDS
ncbi:MAG: 30S ribosomal protein S16 [Holosporaceae bacterium]|nr:MAG: 30S ribosomal protein S16 [Holosporaceae bacterium]